MKYIAITALVTLTISQLCAAAELRRITDAAGDSRAVIVPEAIMTSFSTQAFVAQIPEFLSTLPRGLDVIKLNIVAVDLKSADAARQAIREHFPAGSRPAVSVVIGKVPASAPLAIDAVIVGGAGHGSRVYISGQAEKGASAREAAAKTIESLLATLKFLNCDARDVRHARCFLTPIDAADEVREEFRKVFRGAELPIAFVEWKSNLPIEIELVVAGPPARADAPAVEYLTPTGKTASPLFARVVRVNRGDSIFIGDLYAQQTGHGEGQVVSIFKQLQQILTESGSDIRHLVKATYYVSDDDASKKLNDLRPKYYDPNRPPAASKAMVPAVGVADRSISIDMIAVPTQPTP